MSNYTVRRIKTEDWQDIHELNVKMGYNYGPENVERRIQSILDASTDIVLVIEVEGKVEGYVHGTPYNTLYTDRLVNIIAFVVSVEYRECKEMTDAILAQFDQEAKRNGYHGVRMTANADRKILHGIMVDNGFENNRDLKHYIKSF